MAIELIYRGASSGGAVKSVNGKTGEVILTAEDLGALPNSTVIPSVEGLASEAYVNEAISAVCDVSLIEPAEDDIPKVFFDEAIPQTKDDFVTKFRYISKTKDFSGWAEFKAQGNSSMNYPKKNMTVKMYADEALEEKLKVDFKGWGKQRKHVYKANWIDLSHARNIVSARIWADIVKSRSNYNTLPEELRTSPNQGAIDGFPVKVYSQGIYQGRYTLNIPKDAWMANMDDKLDNHCILCGENYGSGCFRAAAKIDESDWTDEVHDVVPASIKTRWNEVISFVMNSTDEEFKANLDSYIDVESLLDYYIFGLVSCGLDAFGKNQIYMTFDGVRWIASMYDMDSTWGLYWNGSKFVAADYARTSYEDMVSRQGNLLYIRLEQLFWAELQSRWAELKVGALSMANIINHFERFTDIVPTELVKEDYASTTGGGKFTGIPSQLTNNIRQIRAFALARHNWTDGYIANLTPVIPVPCTGISLSATQLTFTEEGSQTLTATVTPEGCTDSVIWNSSNTSIATVNNGVVTAIANGNCTITVTCGDYSASCSVSVSGIAEPVPCTDISLDKIELVFNGEETQTITATVVPSDTTDTVVWVSSNPAVASISVDGNVCAVQSVRNGNATITVTCGNQTAICAVSVSGIADPTLAYSLAEAKTFDGASDFVDTGVMLFDTNKDFTVLVDFQCAADILNLTVSRNAHFVHSCLESTPWPGFSLHKRAAGTINLGSAVLYNSVVTDRVRVAITKDSASGTVMAKSATASTTLANQSATFEQNVILGCRLDPDGSRSQYWPGTIYQCDIYMRKFSDDEINDYLGI